MFDLDSLLRQVSRTTQTWRLQLEGYNSEELCTQPDVESWSIGQVVMHLIEETNWCLDQVNECLKTNKNAKKSKSPEIEKWFEQNCFPNKRLKGPPDLPTPMQPTSKEALLNKFDDLISKVREVVKEISSSQTKGKTRHPGHGYLDAKEWFHYAEMHMRHHFSQKERIDEYLLNR